MAPVTYRKTGWHCSFFVCRRHQSQFYPYACCTYTPAIIVRTQPVFLVMAAGHFAAAVESCPGHTYTWQYLAKATSPPTPCCNKGLAGNAFSHMPVMSDCAIASQLPAARLQFSDRPWYSYHRRSLPMVNAWWAGLLSILHKRCATRCRWPYFYLSSEILTMRYLTAAAPADCHESGKVHCSPGNWAGMEPW